MWGDGDLPYRLVPCIEMMVPTHHPLKTGSLQYGSSMNSGEGADIEGFRESISRRFRSSVPGALFANVGSTEPIKISRVISPPVKTEELPAESAFVVHVHMAPLPELDIWIDGRHAEMPSLHIGEVVILDLDAAPFAHIHHPMDFMLVQISKRTLEDIAYDRGERPPRGLHPTLGGTRDQVLHGLSSALADRLETYGPEDSLFVDYAALAFHAHIVRAYGEVRDPVHPRGGLAPWQSRRACGMMTADLSGRVTIAELAAGCSLSVSYFVHAFRKTMGIPPHKWLMDQRLRRAKSLLRRTKLTLSEIALMCGFADQSHLTRAFSRQEGSPPGQWRRLARD